MSNTSSTGAPTPQPLALSGRLARAETVEDAVARTLELAEATFDEPIVRVYAPEPGDDSCTTIGSAAPPTAAVDELPDSVPTAVAEEYGQHEGDPPDVDPRGASGVRVDSDPSGVLEAQAFVPVGPDRVLCIGVTDTDGFDEWDLAAAEAIGTHGGLALARIDGQGSPRTGSGAAAPAVDDGHEPGRTRVQRTDHANALRELNECVLDDAGFEETVDRLLSLGCEYFGLDTGILSHVDGTNYEVEAVVDATGTHEPGAAYELGETMCDATLAGGRTGSLAFADVADTEHRDHPAAADVRAYVAAPVVVDGETYGTVNFSMQSPRVQAFAPAEREFVTLLSQWLGSEIEDRRRLEELERYETILEAVGDPVYALDAEGHFTFVNEAAQREFGYGPEVLGESPSVGMTEADVAALQGQIENLLATADRSTTAEFELETPEGERRVVENRLALIGDDEFRGTAGVLRDVTARRERRRQLESFQRAIESARDGVAILDDGEYTYIDRSHVDMYGFDGKDQLLGHSWRELYDDAEVERLEAEAFPALESDGYWRGMVTGTRPDGSTFPAELSLTIVDDGRLVCTVRDETERRARERELELRERAMNEASVGIQITDPAEPGNPLVYVNDGFEQMTGYSREEALGQNPRFLQSEVTDPEKRARLRDAIAAEEPVSLELQNVRKDGTPYWSRISVTPVTDDRGEVRNFVGIQQDVTERREREAKIKARQDFLKRLYEVTTDPTSSFEEKISGLLDAGRTHLDLPYGFLTRIDTGDETTPSIQTIVEALGTHDRLQPGERAPLSESYCRKTVAGGGFMTVEDAVAEGWAGDPAYETFGLETYIGTEVVAGEDLYGTLCFASDEPHADSFTEFERSIIRLAGRWAGYEIERRNAREELGRQRERLELTLAGTNTGLAEWDLETDAVEWNETLVDIVGRDVETVEEFRAAVYPADRERVVNELEAMLETGETWAGEFRVVDDDGDVLWLGARTTPIYDDDGTPVRVLSTATDVTDRKASERERRRNERRFQSVLEDPEMLVGLLDTDGTLLEVNETGLSYVEATAADVTGRPFWETPWWAHSEELQGDLREWIRRAADGEYVDYEATNPTPDGDERRVTGTIRPVADESGSVESLVISGQDVTERYRQQRELEDRQRKLDLVLSNTDTSVAELDMAAGTVHWDEMWGDNEIGSPSTVESFIDIVHPKDRERMQADIRTMLETGEQLDGEYRLEREDGGFGWVAAQAVPVLDDAGAVTERVVAIATDITDLKEREQALEESQERYRTLLEAAPDPVIVADATAGDILEVNAAAEELLGRPRADLIGRDHADLYRADDAAAYEDSFERSIGESTIVSELPNGAQPELCTADGEAVPVEIHTDTVELPEGPALYGVFRDITEREERKRELELKERAMDEANVGITISDPDQPDNPLVYVNDGFVEQTGYSRDDALGLNCRFLQADDRDQSALDRLRDDVAAEAATTVELRNYRKDGELFWNRLSVTPVYDEADDLVNYIGIQQDVTREKTTEQRLQALHETTRDLLEAEDREEAVAVAVDALGEELDFSVAGIYLREGDELVRAASTNALSGQASDSIERGRTPLWEVLDAGEPVVYDDVAAIDDDIDRGPVTKSAYFPIGNAAVAVVGVRDPERLDESEQRLVEVLAGNLESVLDNIDRRRELTEEQERFRLLTESVEEYAFVTLDEDGDVQTWNRGAENMFGYDADAAVGMPTARLHPEADRGSGLVDRLLQQARIAGESAHEGWRVRADGSEFYADVRYASLESADGTFRGFAKIVRDMTDRRRQQRRTERFVEESDDVVTIVDPDGTVTYASGSASRVLGYEPTDLLGENLFDYLHPDGREHAMRTFQACIEERENTKAECRLRSPDEGWINVEGRCRNMLDDEAIDGVLVYIRDVTETKERARRFESIFNQTFQFTGLLQPDGTVTEVNDAALAFGGVPRDAIRGENFSETPYWTHSESVQANLRTAIRQARDGEFVRYETEVRGADGLATIDFSVKPVFDDDQNVSLLVVEGRDITARKQQRQHLEVLQRVMRHNMRNDLTKLRGWTELLCKEDDAETRAQQFEVVEDILGKWQGMTERMAKIRRVIRSQEEEPDMRESEGLVAGAVASVQEEYPAAEITSDVSNGESVKLPSTVLDAVRELVENAAATGPETSVTVSHAGQADGWVEIDVTDDGPGLPEMEANVLETGEETSLNHGQGLGLWMVRVIVMQAGGDVSVESTPDGTVVRLRLPTYRKTKTPSV